MARPDIGAGRRGRMSLITSAATAGAISSVLTYKPLLRSVISVGERCQVKVKCRTGSTS